MAPNGPTPRDDSRYSRREFLQRSAAGAAALGVGGYLTVHGFPTSVRPRATIEELTAEKTKTATPKRGGTFRLACTGGDSSDTLDGNAAVNSCDFARSPQLYDCLMTIDATGVAAPSLAEEVIPNSDATEWTIRLRKGVEFHNGKTLTVDDVLFTFNRIISNGFSAASGLKSMNLKDAKKLDTYTLSIPMVSGYSILPYSLIGPGEMAIVPEGYTPKKPIGTGAFKYESFTPGVQSTFGRNDNYWRSGQPYFDAVVISDYTDESSQDDALISGAVDAITQLSIGSVATLKSAGQAVDVWDGPGWVPFTMRLDQAPFNDVNVRQALRYCVDRVQMRTEVFGGYGLIGNDVFGYLHPTYDMALPQRQQDIDMAKHLLKKAGHETLNVTLVTAPIKTGATEMATVLKENAAQAGINISLDSVTSTTFFGPNYTKWTFAQDWWSGYPYLRQVGYSMAPGAVWDETHWDKSPYIDTYLKLWNEALSTVDTAKQYDITHEMMTMTYDYGGYIIPVFVPVIAAQSTKVQGVSKNQKTGTPWIQYNFRSLWFS